MNHCRPRPTFCALIIAFSAQLLLFAGITAAEAHTGGDREYLPGRLIVKMEDEQTFFQEMQKRDTRQSKLPDDGQSGWIAAAADGPEPMLSVYMEEYGMRDMQTVFRRNASDGLGRLKRAGSQPDRLRELAEGLERTYMISYASDEDPMTLAEELSRLPGVVYAEPHFVHETTGNMSESAGQIRETVTEYIPDDPRIGDEGHDYFGYQNFFGAWALSQGSSDVVISIVDSGVFYDHPDLRNKLWRNPEPGRADEFFRWTIENDTIGWNFWESGDVFIGEEPEQNADPVGNYSTHGTHVAGTAAADTDNGIGVAGTGFNATFMPVKTGGTRDYPRNIAFGYHGILYAAVNEADIINCSFGGTSYSEFGRDVVEFATASGSLVVAAAGNNGEDVLFYPAAFDDVLTVGSVRRQYDDVISHFSNYGFYVDVFAMGEALLSTFFEYDSEEVSWNATYQRNTGTSMAAPVVSGLAALIKAGNPDWSPQRIASQIRTNARSIRQTNPEEKYEHRLGRGLIDAQAALENMKPGLRFVDFAFESPDGDKLNAGESGFLTLQAVNFGESSGGIDVRITPQQDGLELQPESQSTGQAKTGDTLSLTFEITISDDYRLDEIPLFRIDMEDPALDYDDFAMLEYERLLFDVLDINTITASVSSDGTIGYMDALSARGGVGFIPDEYDNVLFEGGLMISAELERENAGPHIPVTVNQVRDSTEITRHFLPEKNLRFTAPGSVSDLDGLAEFRSTEHPVADALSVRMKTYAFAAEPLDQSFLVTYEITNRSMNTYHNMHVGLFNDWDIREADTDRTGFIEEDSLIYAYDPAGPPYVTAAQLGAVSSAFAIDNTSPMSLPEAGSREDSLRFGIYYREAEANYDGFTDAEKRLSLTAGTERTTIEDTDISIVTGTGPFTVGPFGRITVGFVYAWGEDVDDLRSQVAAARELPDIRVSRPGEYRRERDEPERAKLYQNFPNPFSSSTMIEFYMTEEGPAELSVYDVLGRRIATIFDGEADRQINLVEFNAGRLGSGVYIVVLRAEGRSQAIKMTLVK